ncbi:unnamed protein product [Rhizophagus irregularis]|nr:unnamed protein product [Rhizophagus irregularis]
MKTFVVFGKNLENVTLNGFKKAAIKEEKAPKFDNFAVEPKVNLEIVVDTLTTWWGLSRTCRANQVGGL